MAEYRIDDLARNMIRLSRLRPEVDIEIRHVGLRPGEKLFEELAIDGEHVLPTRHPQIGVLRSREEDFKVIIQGIDDLTRSCNSMDTEAIRNQLRALVAEYDPQTDDVEDLARPGQSTST